MLSGLWAYLKTVRRWVWHSLLGVAILSASGAFYWRHVKAEEAAAAQAAKDLAKAAAKAEREAAKAEKAKADAHTDRIRVNDEWARKYANEWTAAFLGDRKAVCFYSYVNDTEVCTVACHIGEQNKDPTKVLTCTQVGCDYRNLP